MAASIKFKGWMKVIDRSGLPWAVQAMGLAADSLMNYLALARI